jgi:hypothetical protein
MATNAILNNFAIVPALPRIARAGVDGGVLKESLKASISSGDDDSNAWRIRSFQADRN